MLKKIVYVLVGGFVAINIAVGFIPEITGISTSGLAGVTKAVVDIALWLIPLGVGFLILMMGAGVFMRSKNKRFARSRASVVALRNAWRPIRHNIGADWHNQVARRYYRLRDRKRR